MKIMASKKTYDRAEFIFEADDSIDSIQIKKPDGNVESVSPFVYKPIDIKYDEEGWENVEPLGKIEYRCRFTPDIPGEYTVQMKKADGKIHEKCFTVERSENHGYVTVDSRDKRYFAYTDGTPFFAVGINLCFPTVYIQSDGTEFGHGNRFRYIGLRQYERWFKKCSENAINMARIWLGCEYFSPDKEDAVDFEYEQFSKIDLLLKLAEKYGIKLKLTIEQFRYFDYDYNPESLSYSDDLYKKFSKRLYHKGRRCESIDEWMNNEKWQQLWLKKVEELAKRYAGDTNIFAIELWNEMNSVALKHWEKNIVDTLDMWNKKMLGKVRGMFPRNMVVNSMGSLDGNRAADIYKSFCWNYSDFVQLHRYLDQGAEFSECRGSMAEVVITGINRVKTDKKPFILAETGAVNNCHSGPFRYYVNDDRGMLLADAVYIPVFLGSACCGNIWHWDERYVEAKNLYRMYKPLSELVSDIDFGSEQFESIDLSDDKVYALILTGKNVILGYIRNKKDNWKSVLRDLKKPVKLGDVYLSVGDTDKISQYRIWDDETAEISIDGNRICIKGLKYGIMFKALKKRN